MHVVIGRPRLTLFGVWIRFVTPRLLVVSLSPVCQHPPPSCRAHHRSSWNTSSWRWCLASVPRLSLSCAPFTISSPALLAALSTQLSSAPTHLTCAHTSFLLPSLHCPVPVPVSPEPLSASTASLTASPASLSFQYPTLSAAPRATHQ